MINLGAIRDRIDIDLDVTTVVTDSKGREIEQIVTQRIHNCDIQDEDSTVQLTAAGVRGAANAIIIMKYNTIVKTGMTFTVVKTGDRYRFGSLQRWPDFGVLLAGLENLK